MQKFDTIIIGAGIVGLATAHILSKKHPQKKILVIDKENQVAKHQTGHNSGVIHSGIYYKPGSLKALNCREGKHMMEDFCRDNGVPVSICGKVIVAFDEAERDRLHALYERGKANGVDCQIIDRQTLKEIEPHCAGLEAIWVKETGIVDYKQVCSCFVNLLQKKQNEVILGAEAIGVRESATGVVVQTTRGEFDASYVVNCGGLYSDRIASFGKGKPQIRIVPFRGEYYEVHPGQASLCRNLIYPVPDPRFPFLGVHFTRMISGKVECGPNAVFAFAREGYHLTDINLGELLGALFFPGFIKMSAKYWQMGLGEMWRSVSKATFVRSLQRLIPDIQSQHLEPAPAGVRAQAVASDGSLLDDFAFSESARIVNVLNAPSPAATASLSIGTSIVEKLAKRFI
jgi:L-2-hydroxyglutarate oxidase